MPPKKEKGSSSIPPISTTIDPSPKTESNSTTPKSTSTGSSLPSIKTPKNSTTTNAPIATKGVVVSPSVTPSTKANTNNKGKLPSLDVPTTGHSLSAKQVEEQAKAEAKKKEEEEKKRKEEEDMIKKKLEEALREKELEEKKKRENGEVTLIYNLYNEKFKIVDGSTSHANIDDIYALSFVMPECLIHLSKYNDKDKTKREREGILDNYVKEEPRGIYKGLEANETYYVYVEQETDQLERERQIAKSINIEGGVPVKKDPLNVKDDGRGFESCSCIEGNPCVDEYGCRDWAMRFTIAKKNGWKGFDGRGGAL